MPFLFQPLPQTEARDRIAGLPLVTREVMDNMLPELRAYAFTLTGLDVGDQMARVRDEIAAVPMGAKTWAQAKKTIAADLKEKLGGKESQRRAELLLRTHVFRGYAAARYRALMAQTDIFPYWQYKTHGDGNVRPSHAALNGKIFPAGHDIWQQIFPPWDWGCRCLVVPLTAGAVGRIQDAGMPSNKDASLLPTQIAKPEVFSAREADLINQSKKLPGGISLNHAPTWSAAPWSIPGNIRHDWPLIEARYGDQPEVLEAFKQWAAKTEMPDMAGATVHDWISAENSRGFFGGMDGSQKTAFVRAGENALLKRTRPARKAPVSDKVSNITTTAQGMALDKAKWLIDHAHDDGDIDPVTMSATTLGGDIVGAYSHKSPPIPAQIRIRKDADHPIMTTLHELGHHLRNYLNPKDVVAVTALARKTKVAQLIRELDLKPGYHLDESELFSRIYAQWIAETTRDAEALAELDGILGSSFAFTQFGDSDWLPVRDKLVFILKKKGWIK